MDIRPPFSAEAMEYVSSAQGALKRPKSARNIQPPTDEHLLEWSQRLEKQRVVTPVLRRKK